MSTLQVVSLAIGIGTTIAGAIIALVRLGFRVGTIAHRIDSLEVSSKDWNINNREKINEMTESNNEQNISIQLLKQQLDNMGNDIKDIKSALNAITSYIKDSETNRAKIESRLDYLERTKNGK